MSLCFLRDINSRVKISFKTHEGLCSLSTTANAAWIDADRQAIYLFTVFSVLFKYL